MRTLLTFTAGSITLIILLVSILASGFFILFRNVNWSRLLNALEIDFNATNSVTQSKTILNEESSIIDVVENSSSAVVSVAVE